MRDIYDRISDGFSFPPALRAYQQPLGADRLHQGAKPPKVRSLRSAPFTTCISSGEPSVRYRSLPALVVAYLALALLATYLKPP
jgi:hypothetical protein